MIKVYFACSIRGGRDDAEPYGQLIDIIKQRAIVLSEIFADNTLTAEGMKKSSESIWKTDMQWLHEADIVIAEVTNPSLGVGYEIAKAETYKTPVLALYRPQPNRKLSTMISGSPATIVVEYDTIASAEHAINTFLEHGPKS